MDERGTDEDDLPTLLSALDQRPDDVALRRRACAVATHAALHLHDPLLADVAETLAAEGRAGAFREELKTARLARRALCERAGRESGAPGEIRLAAGAELA